MPCRTECCYVCFGTALCSYCVCHGGTGVFPREKASKIVNKSIDLEGALCDVLTILDQENLLDEVDEDVINWWEKHTKEEEEKIRKEVYAKLTPRERKVLKLYQFLIWEVASPTGRLNSFCDPILADGLIAKLRRMTRCGLACDTSYAC